MSLPPRELPRVLRLVVRVDGGGAVQRHADPLAAAAQVEIESKI